MRLEAHLNGAQYLGPRSSHSLGAELQNKIFRKASSDCPDRPLPLHMPISSLSAGSRSKVSSIEGSRSLAEYEDTLRDVILVDANGAALKSCRLSQWNRPMDIACGIK